MGYEPDFWVAYRVAFYPSFLFLLDSHSFYSSLSLGWVERPLCPGALSVFGGILILLCRWACIVELGLGQMG